MEELVKRLAVMRTSGKIVNVFDKRPSKAEFKRPGKAEFKMSCLPAMMEYTME